MMQWRELICGDRNWSCERCVQDFVATLPRLSVVIEGCARGADSMAARAATARGLVVIHEPAHWDHDPRTCAGLPVHCATDCKRMIGRPAGMIRNSAMLKHEPDHVTAFHNDLSKSKGTKGMIRLAERADIPTEVRTCPHR